VTDQMPANVLEENSRQMDRHKKRLVFGTVIGNTEVCAEVHALQSGGDGAPERRHLYTYSQPCLPLVNGFVDDALRNTVPSVNA